MSREIVQTAIIQSLQGLERTLQGNWLLVAQRQEGRITVTDEVQVYLPFEVEARSWIRTFNSGPVSQSYGSST